MPRKGTHDNLKRFVKKDDFRSRVKANFQKIMTPKRRDLNPSGLGRAIINKKVKDARLKQESGLFTTDGDATSRLKSVTQEGDLDEFLNNAQLAGTQFTAERRNVKIIQQSARPVHNPYLLTEQEERSEIMRHQENKQRLRVPRRPPWTKDMDLSQLEAQEGRAFLDWRRGLARLQENENFLLTPFERNIEVWRQLWRVLERSHLVVQIIDSRNPLRFRCEDLESYVKDIKGSEGEQDSGKGMRKNLLLINKADLLTPQQRRIWADYFDRNNIQYAFYSAAIAVASQQERRDAEVFQKEVEQSPFSQTGEGGDTSSSYAERHIVQAAVDKLDDNHSEISHAQTSESVKSDDEDVYFSAEEDTTDEQNLRTKILSAKELEELFLEEAPDLSEFTDSSGKHPTKLVVGLVGYPNVGKSSTINSLIGEKRVSVSSTPGKTKHFQTIHLSDSIVLCDCPGLVFPQFATTKADLICDGILPIDQMREHTGPITLVIQRIPKAVLEAVYGLTLWARGAEDGGDGILTAEDFLVPHAIGRGYMRAGQGNPDEARSARYILKDYVNGKLLFTHPPPDILKEAFNERTHQLALQKARHKKHAPATRVGKDAATFVPSNIHTSNSEHTLPLLGVKSMALDDEFFGNTDSTFSGLVFAQGSHDSGQAFTRARMFPHQNMVADDGTPLDSDRVRMATILARTGDIRVDKKHHKKEKRVKQRSGQGYN